MPFEFIQIPAYGQGGAMEQLNKLRRGGRIAKVSKKFVPNGEDSFGAFCIECLGGQLVAGKSTSGQKVDVNDVLKEVHSADDFAVFSQLRKLCMMIVDKAPIPFYSILLTSNFHF
jgi:hypothetical protein